MTLFWRRCLFGPQETGQGCCLKTGAIRHYSLLSFLYEIDSLIVCQYSGNLWLFLVRELRTLSVVGIDNATKWTGTFWVFSVSTTAEWSFIRNKWCCKILTRVWFKDHPCFIFVRITFYFRLRRRTNFFARCVTQLRWQSGTRIKSFLHLCKIILLGFLRSSMFLLGFNDCIRDYFPFVYFQRSGYWSL